MNMIDYILIKKKLNDDKHPGIKKHYFGGYTLGCIEKLTFTAYFQSADKD